MHVNEEQLQRLVDDELDEFADPATEWAQEHMVHCQSCRERVTRAKHEQDEVFALLGNLDHPRARIDHTELIARARARDSRWMAKAAGFVVAAALAGAAYAAPGSPLPSLAAGIFGNSSAAPTRRVVQKTAPEATVVSGLTVATGNRMVIVFSATQASGNIRVTLGDVQEIEVRATGTGASFTAGEDVLTVGNANSLADFTIEIPRNARLVEIRIGEERVFLKDGTRIVARHAATGMDAYVIPLTAGR